MTEGNTHGDKVDDGNPVEAEPPPFDAPTIRAERRIATDRLLARLKVIEAKQETQTLRAYASRYVREQEPVIRRLLDAGVGTDEILADLVISFRSIPRADLRHAIAQLRDRRRKQVVPTMAGSSQATPTQHRESVGAARPGTLGNSELPADDRRPDESDEDYRLRKALEGSDDQRRLFIGEH